MSFVGLLLVGKRAKDVIVALCCFNERASWRSKWKDDRLPYNCDSTRQSCHFVRWATYQSWWQPVFRKQS